jgi:hypothetical protein
LQKDLQLNVDLTVAMPCHCESTDEPLMIDLTIDLRDAVGDRLHLSDDFVKDPVSLRVNKLIADDIYPGQSNLYEVRYL